jgi:hypothetical protein
LSVASAPTGSTAAARAATQARAVRAALGPWLPRLAAAAAIVAITAVGVAYVWSAATTVKPRVAMVEPAPILPPPGGRTTTGSARVTSTPTGAQVIVDGKARGVTPLTLTDLIAGRHTIEIRSEAGSVQRTVIVVADKTSDVDAAIFSGWLAVYSPFDVLLFEGGRALRLDDRNQIMLTPGRHELRLVNRALAYDAVHDVDLKPGEMTTLTVAPPPSSLNVTATEPAEVWVDGQRIGESPLSAAVALGTHDIVVKRAAGGERRFTVTITVNPFTLNVDFSKPGPG